MIDLGSALPSALNRLKRLEVGGFVELLTFKRDRGVEILRTGEDRFEVREFGYRDETVQAGQKDLRRLLKTVLKREFPRSNKVHLREGQRGSGGR
ncbi:MAG: hypothetical protein AB7E51_15505 [Pseudodesulfovibrio sp.]|jgi:hypothetical protein|uniref:DUF4388 domain-containing protein n=1 Tax=Pseudodesulfovibrio indicus TaxID=1716143 RepID=A0A126QL28_9BACT|nr:hypothetical protein [Pseudodesulfovibrio indicus]AMK10681.1 hypothetical protein AWY79_05935 [Pseudodesulfovibrio indicus]TDT91660.1 hypothetical protein EDC59_10157 [Pseudodesulfovibrio indicus]